MSRPTLAQRRDGVIHVAGPCAPPGVGPDDPAYCCYGAVIRGPEHCTCWEPIFDLEQQELREPAGEVATRAKCCHDCAYRHGSPERTDEYEEDALLALPYDGEFWCHQGVRRAIACRHSDGRELPAGDGDYQPPTTRDADGKGLIWRADGTPGERCAGWAALVGKHGGRKPAHPPNPEVKESL